MPEPLHHRHAGARGSTRIKWAPTVWSSAQVNKHHQKNKTHGIQVICHYPESPPEPGQETQPARARTSNSPPAASTLQRHHFKAWHLSAHTATLARRPGANQVTPKSLATEGQKANIVQVMSLWENGETQPCQEGNLVF